MSIVEDMEKQLDRLAVPGLVRQGPKWQDTKITVTDWARQTDPAEQALAGDRERLARARDERQAAGQALLRMLSRACDDQEAEQRALTGSLLDEPIAGETRVVDYVKYFGNLDTDARQGLANLAKLVDVSGAARPWFRLLSDYIASLPQGAKVREMDPRLRDEFMGALCRAAAGKEQ